jgi:hypothetical protein
MTYHRYSVSTADGDKIKVEKSKHIRRQRLNIHIKMNILTKCGPSDNDVLCTKSRIALCHHGNIMFSQLIDANLLLFRNCTATHKLLLAQSIVDALDTRFLMKQGECGWYDIGYKAAIQYTLNLLESLQNESVLGNA